ncbi:MAG TPA: hypothetical protein VIL24_03860 [Clostridia bacterium]
MMEDNALSFEEKIYQELYNRQNIYAKKLALIILGGVGGVFLVLGIVFLFLGDVLTILGIVYACVGLILTLSGLIIYAVVSKTKPIGYQSLLDKLEKYGILNTFDMTAMIIIQQAKIRQLEKEILELKQKLNK